MPHQCDAVSRLGVQLERGGGALLADEVGLGKSYVALALASRAARPLVVGPAALRSTWLASMQRARVVAPFISYEALSRLRSPLPEWDLVILDEAHHARNPRTRRYEALVTLTTRARILMLSATPIHNSGRDLRALVALFVGGAAYHMDERQLARHVLRRERADLDGSPKMPALRTMEWVDIADDEELLNGILALPPPVPPRDGHTGGVLLAITLARLWSSSRAALAGALRRRLARAASLEQALEAGRHPTATELSSWSGDADSVQLGFAEILVESRTEPFEQTQLTAAVREHAAAVRVLLHRLMENDAPDRARADRLDSICRQHTGARIVAFATFTETALQVYRAIRSRARACVLTSAGAQVAGGRLSRDEALAAFTPGASTRQRVAEAIDLLVTTDLASEGVDLQDASVVVHLDLPWTAARLEQRIGRLRRLGSPHSTVWSYAFSPPAATRTLLGIEARLRDKLRTAREMVGTDWMLLPAANATTGAEPAPRCEERLRRSVAAWRLADAGAQQHDGAPLIAAVTSVARGWLAVVHHQTGDRVIGCRDAQVSDDPAWLADLTALAKGDDTRYSVPEARKAFAELEGWLAAQHVRAGSGLDERPILEVRGRLLRRIALAARGTTPARRVGTLTLAAQARRAALRRLTLGRESELLALCDADLPPDDWLRAVADFDDSNPAPGPDPHPPSIKALLILVKGAEGTAPFEKPEGTADKQH